MVLSLALARIRFAFWVSSAPMDVRQPLPFALAPPVAADSTRPLQDFSRHTVPPPHPYAPELSDEEPTWEDAEWQ